MTRMRYKADRNVSPWDLRVGDWIATDSGFLQQCRDDIRLYLRVGRSDKTAVRRFFAVADRYDNRARVVEVMKVKRRSICRVFLETGPRGSEETMNFTFRGDAPSILFTLPPDTPEPSKGSLRNTKRHVDLS